MKKKGITSIAIVDAQQLDETTLFAAFRVHPTFENMWSLAMGNSAEDLKKANLGMQQMLQKQLLDSVFIFNSLPQAQVVLDFPSGLSISMIRFFNKQALEASQIQALMMGKEPIPAHFFTYELGISLKQHSFHIERFATFESAAQSVKTLWGKEELICKLIASISTGRSNMVLNTQEIERLDCPWMMELFKDFAMQRFVNAKKWSVSRCNALENTLEQLERFDASDDWKKDWIERVIKLPESVPSPKHEVFLAFLKQSKLQEHYIQHLNEYSKEGGFFFSSEKKYQSQAQHLHGWVCSMLEQEQLASNVCKEAMDNTQKTVKRKKIGL